MTAFPQIREVGGAAGAPIVVTVPGGTTSATFTKEVWNDHSGTLGANTVFAGYLKLLDFDGTATQTSGTYPLDALVVRARVAGTINTTAYTSQLVKLGSAHYLKLPPLPPNSAATVEIKVVAPGDAPLNAFELLLRAVPGTIPAAPDLELTSNYTDVLADATEAFPHVRVMVFDPLPTAATLDSWAFDVSDVSPAWSSGSLTLGIRAINPGDPITSAGTSIIGTGTAPSIAFDATTLRVTGSDMEFRSFAAGTRFVADVTNAPTSTAAEEPETIWGTLRFRRDA